MDLTSRLEGYLNHEIAYTNPIPTLPVPKTLHDKKDTTLLQMAMKAFVKQRLFGRLNNYERDNKPNKNHLTNISQSIAENSRFVSSINQNNTKTKESLKRDNNESMFAEISHGYLTEDIKVTFVKSKQQKQKAINIQEKRLSQISSSFNFKTKGSSPQYKTPMNSHARLKSKHLTPLHQSFNLKHSHNNHLAHDQQDHPGTSFISAIDYYKNQNPSLIERSSNEKLKLPEIVDKRKNMTSKLDLSKNQKTFNKKQTLPQVSVNNQFWSFLSKDNQQKPRRIRENKSTQMRESIVSILKFSDSIEQNKNISNLKNSDTSLLSKELFQGFINNSKLSIPFFLLSVLNFFELMNKITDKSKKTDFESCFSTLFNYPDRAWSVALFRFLDLNTDGKIDSSDFFKIHNLLEEIIEKVQSFKPNSGQESLANESVQFKKKLNKRQATQMSQNQSYNRNQKQKTQTKEKVDKLTKQKTDESQRMSEESYQIVTNFMKNNLENLQTFQKYVQKLNLRFLQKDKSINRNKDFYNPQNQQDHKNQKSSKNSPEIRYLQEALLKNKELKISDLNLILQELHYQNSKTKKKVIDIDYKKLNIKLSSSYVQTFIATNHNEETRMNRQHLQSLKDNLKNPLNVNIHTSNVHETKVLPSIKYAQFYEEKLFLPFKNIFFQCLHSDIAEVK